METRTRIALGLAGGYLLGRFRKARWLLALAAVGSSPEVRKLVQQGRENVVSALSTGMEGLNERIHAATESLRGDSPNGQGPQGEQPESQSGEPKGQDESTDEGEPEDEAESERQNGEPTDQDQPTKQDEPEGREEPQDRDTSKQQGEPAADDGVKPPGGSPKHRQPQPTSASQGGEQAAANVADEDGDRERTPSARVSGRPASVRGRR